MCHPSLNTVFDPTQCLAILKISLYIWYVYVALCWTTRKCITLTPLTPLVNLVVAGVENLNILNRNVFESFNVGL